MKNRLSYIGGMVTTPICTECGSRGVAVGLKTLKHLLREEVSGDIIEERTYLFCPYTDCNIVYFSGDSLFTKDKLRVRVGLKEKEPPIPVCYCFGITKEDILKEIEERGVSTASEKIKKEIEVGNCFCEVKSPSGRCCLGNVVKVEKEFNPYNS